MKIDVTKIEGYADMTAEQKLAALEGFEYDDHTADAAKYKKAAEDWKKKHDARLTDDEKRAQELAEMKAEVAALKRDKLISGYRADFLSQGYDETLAAETASALADGNMEMVFANQKKFLAGYRQKVEADLLNATPRPAGGSGAPGADYPKLIADAQAVGNTAAVAYYTRLQAQEAQN